VVRVETAISWGGLICGGDPRFEAGGGDQATRA